MAKKGQPVQLQTEITNDEEWEKLLGKDGLIVVDIYSEWCGPCSGMLANLKKIKLELGGDLLQLAVAKCDNIEALARFRTKSEPTWMFISKGKMVNFVYGADAPKLMRVITEELKKEQEVLAGVRQRTDVIEISEMAEPERIRYEAAQKKIAEEKAIEEEKKANELRQRRTAECQNILDALPNLGIILIFPSAVPKYKEILPDIFQEAGLVISQTDKVLINKTQIEELFYFANENQYLSEETLQEIYTKESIALLIKVSPHAPDLTVTMEAALLSLIYGSMKQPPGDDDSPYQKLLTITEEQVIEKRIQKEGTDSIQNQEEGITTDNIFEETSEKEEQDIQVEIIPSVELNGIWTAPSNVIKAVALKLFFSRVVEQFLIPEPEQVPPHYIIAFDAKRRREVLRTAIKYNNEILHYGFFTSEIAEQAELIAKNLCKYEKRGVRVLPNEKLVLQVSKRKSECVFNLAQMSPIYISPNTAAGSIEAKIFFPDDYEEPPDEDEEEYIMSDNTIIVFSDIDSIDVDTKNLDMEEIYEKNVEEDDIESEYKEKEDLLNLDDISDFPCVITEDSLSPCEEKETLD